jgi:hypothetical protein
MLDAWYGWEIGLGFVTRLTQRVPLVEQELLTLQEHLSWPPVFSGLCIAQSLVLYVDHLIYVDGLWLKF